MEEQPDNKLLSSLRELCRRSGNMEEIFESFTGFQTLSKSDEGTVKSSLSALLLKPDYSVLVSQCFPQLILELLLLHEETEKEYGLPESERDCQHKLMCVALGKLVNIHPQAFRFSLQYFEKNPAPFCSVSSSSSPSSAKRMKLSSESADAQLTELDIVKCCYSFLNIDADYFRQCWSWSDFIELYIGHEDPVTCWLACQCVALVTGMTDAQRQALVNEHLSLEVARTCATKFDNYGREFSTTDEASSELKTAEDEYVCHVSPLVVSICGIQLLVLNPDLQDQKGCLVQVNSTVQNLKSLALAVASGRAVCLQGPVGCGKTSLVEHLAHLTGRTPPQFQKVQLGDQTDSKMLLGTYRCTDIPGEFIWQPGVLTQAVIGGHWILLEDIDSATADVISVLHSLMETGILSVPGFRDSVKVTPGFQLFVTKRLLPGLGGYIQSNDIAFLQKNWVQIYVEPLSRDELIEIIQTVFPSLHTVSSRFVDIFLMFSSGNHTSSVQLNSSDRSVSASGTSRRLISTRDLIKLCTRACEVFDLTSPDSQMKVFQSAFDVFCSSITSPVTRIKQAVAVGGHLGIIGPRIEHFCNTYRANILVQGDFVIAGRIRLPHYANEFTQLDSVNDISRSFAFTRAASNLLERIACCVKLVEPVLLVGETGTGKTAVVQYLAQRTGHHLIVINMNQQSDSADLLGGYKPIDVKYIVGPVRDEFEFLFRNFFNVQQNLKFLKHISTCYNTRRWVTLLKLMKHSHAAAMKRIDDAGDDACCGEDVRYAWHQLGAKLYKLETQLKTQTALAFSFIEGSLVRALKEGHWVLLDEINLASAETLECLSGLLEDSVGSLLLLERGDNEPIRRHPDFRLFACMNPATDVGKKDLPTGLRNRFTEFFVDELLDNIDLTFLVRSYLRNFAISPTKEAAIVHFYIHIRKEATMRLTDGTGHKPHYSLRTLCRALSVAAQNSCGSIPRSLYEAFCMSFLTQLDFSSHPHVVRMVRRYVIGQADGSILKQEIPMPSNESQNYVNFEGYWIPQGMLEPVRDEKYILTQTVQRNLHDLVRIVSIGRLPILLQGETSVGKTSLITYLAQASGNHCVRINNHEHTDLQEYIGSYSADESGHLVFQEGVLVEAMRKGHWIILDELNLAPTDVLEALNRVLDDNRELFISETQEVVRAHPSFMLFATQNPPGLYGGRKMLSRAFRNRFVELHFDEIPAKELEEILHRRCAIPLSYSVKMVAVMTELQIRRKGSAAFAGKQGYVTLRDLFRWGERYRLAGEQATQFYDWDQHIADEGYLVLAGRVRKQHECIEIQEVIKKQIKRDVNPERLFTLTSETSPVTRPILQLVLTNPPPGFENIVWTFNMRHLAVLVGKACQFKEPILLVGQTGCGKTTMCQMLAAVFSQTLYSVNCHMHTESSDFLGGLRPVRDHTSDPESTKLFEWVDGPLIEAMRNGGLFLADEISLADDSVLERLNSLLEPERKLLLAEKGGDEENSNVIVAQEKFHFIGTMNPGGDFGKKELSPALRNRFTEIWCEAVSERKDLLAIIEQNLKPGLFVGNQEDGTSGVGNLLLDFLEWFTTRTDVGKRLTFSIRDIITWVNFINVCTEDPESKASAEKKLSLPHAYVHGALIVFLDGLGCGVTSRMGTQELQQTCEAALKYLSKQVEFNEKFIVSSFGVVSNETRFGVHPYYVKKGNTAVAPEDFVFTPDVTVLNISRVLRGLQLGKPILLEGGPGVGKTSLIAAVAKATGNTLTRINLSDQTDISDLFGADLPVEGGEGGRFAWRDGPFLRALKAGHWILLDELNLASQSVLEGLNACLDHRGEVYIPELGKTFHIQSGNTHIFGAQNPVKEGGARRGLPQSFLNRFTQVFVETMTDSGMISIIKSLFPILPDDLISRMVSFNCQLTEEIELRHLGQQGAPWDFNIRDLCRWSEIIVDDYKNQTLIDCEEQPDVMFNPGKFVNLIYADRMRTKLDKEKVLGIYKKEFGSQYPLICDFPHIHLTHSTIFIDDIALSRNGRTVQAIEDNKMPNMIQGVPEQEENLILLRRQFPALRSLARCVNMNWLAILVGPSSSGKTCLVHLLSQLLGQELRSLSVNSATDTAEILGGFEQADYNRHLDEIAARIERLLLDAVRRRLLTTIDASPGTSRPDVTNLLRQWEGYQQLSTQDINLLFQTLANETESFLCRLNTLQEITALLFEQNVNEPVFEQELTALSCKLQKLNDNIMKEGGLNAGGKFKWLDSVLVKCLQDGTWLLVDNVNLCSSAILDRLNGLLEPGGVLTIGERGVGPDGELVSIKPHPNFRLFMTLDPRNGELSKSMRNRGVEIYMSGLREEVYKALDMKSLLYNVGLKQNVHQDALLSVLKLMDHNAERTDGSVSQLLHAAFLIVQQTSLGQPLFEAFFSSCRDVYVKSLPQREVGSLGFLALRTNLGEVMKEDLKKSLMKEKTSEDDLKDRLDMNGVTLTVPRVKEDAVLAIVKQEGSILKSLIETIALPRDEEINNITMSHSLDQIVGLQVNLDVRVRLIDMIPHFLLMFYERATPNDVRLRHEWLKQLLGKCMRRNRKSIVLVTLDSFQRTAEVLKETILNALSNVDSHTSLLKHICDIGDLPWDIRWLPSIALLCRHYNQWTCPMCIPANKLLLLMYFRAKKGSPKELPTAENKQSLSVKEYSNALMEGTLSDDLTNEPVITKFSCLIQQFDECLEAALTNEIISISAKESGSFHTALHWRFRFAELGNLQLISSEETDDHRRTTHHVAEVGSHLKVHFKWLSKWALPTLMSLIQQDQALSECEIVQRFLSTLKDISDSLRVTMSFLIPLGKKIKHSMGYPLPRPSIQEVDEMEQLERVSDVMNFWRNGKIADKNNTALVRFLQTRVGLESRNEVAFAFKELHVDFMEVRRIIKEVEQICFEAGLIKHSTEMHVGGGGEGEGFIQIQHVNSMVQLWPAQDLLCLLLSGTLKRFLMSAIMNNILSSQNSASGALAFQNVAKSLFNLMLPLPTIPPFYLALVKVVSESNELVTDPSNHIFRNVIPRLMIMMLHHSEFSPSVHQVKEWMSWHQEKSAIEDAESEMQMDWLNSDTTKQDSLPMHCPVVINMVLSFINSNGYFGDCSSPLGSHKLRVTQLIFMKDFLWKNMMALSSKMLSYKLNDAISAVTYFRIFLETLKTVMKTFTEVPEHTEDSIAKAAAIVQAIAGCDFKRGNNCEDDPFLEKQQFADILMCLAETACRLKEYIAKYENVKAEWNVRAGEDKYMLIATGKVWTLTGLLQVMLFGNLGLIDPVTKKELKLQYNSEEMEETENMLYAQNLQLYIISNKGLDESDKHNLHPRVITQTAHLKHLIKRQEELRKCVAARPDPPQFHLLATDALHYMKSLASCELIINMQKRIVHLISKLDDNDYNDEESPEFIKSAEELLSEEKNWEESQMSFCEKFNKYSSWYPDMALPLISAATMLRSGMHQLTTVLNKKVIVAKLPVLHKEDKLNLFLYNLVCFPTLGANHSSMLSLVNTCVSERTTLLLKKALAEDNLQQFRKEKYRLLKCGLTELKNYIMVKGNLQTEMWTALEQILTQITAAWRFQEDEKKRIETEKEELYVIKGKEQCKTLTEEEQITLELEELFPSSLAEDFEDFQKPTLEETSVRESPRTEHVGLVTEEDMDLICQLHSFIVQSYTSSAWLHPTKMSREKLDFINQLLQRYTTFSALLEKVSRGLSNSLDARLMPSLALLTSVALNHTEDGRTSFAGAGELHLHGSPAHVGKQSVTSASTFDFYRDSYLKETVKCLPILEHLDTRVKELLSCWPEHPTLREIAVLINRILNFSLTSPLARFMTGLELLLDKLHDWEENAHSGVSLSEHWKRVTNQIASWRKIQLHYWRECLDSVANKVRLRASKWWFYMYSVVENFTKHLKTEEENSLPSQKLIETLKRFMEESTLGEFEARLNIMYSFHCHVVNLPQTAERDEMMTIFWNVHSYYSQFSDAVVLNIKELRSLVEKKMRDCVKIFRWNDINHWAIKEAIKKVHRTLHKHVKEFQEILNRPVTECLSDPSLEHDTSVGQWDRPQRQKTRNYQAHSDPSIFVYKLKSLKLKAETDGTILENAATHHYRTAIKISKQIVRHAPYAIYVMSLEGLVIAIIDRTKALKNLSYDENDKKREKMKKAKGYVQQKMKALTDLFDKLRQIGVSYRRGLTYCDEVKPSSVEFTLPPIDLKAALKPLKCRRSDGLMLRVWEGCETYFMRSIARLALLNTVLQNPHKDLDRNIIERCKGFSTHLMVLSRQQKLALTQNCHLLCSLRCKHTELTAMKETDFLLPKQIELHSWNGRLSELLAAAIICLEQFRLCLYCAPDVDNSIYENEPKTPVLELPCLDSPPVEQATKGSEAWKVTANKVKFLIATVTKIKQSVEKSVLVSSSLYDSKTKSVSESTLVAMGQYDALVDSYKQLEGEIMNGIHHVKMNFESFEECQEWKMTEVEYAKSKSKNPMVQSLTWLENYVRKEVGEFKSFQKEVQNLANSKFTTTGEVDDDIEVRECLVVAKFRHDAAEFCENILLIIQNINKKYTSNSTGPVVYDDEKSFEIHDFHLKEKTINSLTDTFSKLQMKKINNDLHGLLQRLRNILEKDADQGNICKKLLLHCYGCMDQLLNLYQFFVIQQISAYRVSSKMLSILLAIFLQLAQKGYCLPSEIKLEDLSNKGTRCSGMGLGEGEGEEDISEQIESEEQLEEARPRDEEKREEDEDCKEEDKGIEMSEDFEGKIQDLDPKEEQEEESEDEKDEEADKEMGDTEAGADKLDHQLWRIDSEDETDFEEDEAEETEEEEEDEERGSGEQIGEPELGAKEDKQEGKAEEDDGTEGNKEQEPKKREINEMDEAEEDDDHIDPYHGNQEPQSEPEALDLPEDLQLDDGERKEGEEEEDIQEENPFDIDTMKEQKSPDPEQLDEEVEDEEDLPEDEEETVDIEEKEDKIEDELGQEQELEKEEAEMPPEEGMEEDTTGGRKDEEKSGEEPKQEEERQKDEETAAPSEDPPTHIPAESATDMDQTSGSKDQVVQKKEDNSELGRQPPEESRAQGEDKDQGVGQAQVEESSSGHQGLTTASQESVQTANPQQELKEEKKQHFRESDTNRSLGEVNEPAQKRLKMMNISSSEQQEPEDQEEEEDGAEQQKNSDMYQHIKEAKTSYDAQTMDAATEEQAEHQPVPNVEEQEAEETKEDEVMDIVDEPEPPVPEEAPKLNAEKMSSEKKIDDNKERAAGEKVDEGGDIEMAVEVEGEKVETHGAVRGSETTFHTMPLATETSESVHPVLSSVEIDQALRSEMEFRLASWSQPPPDKQAENAWVMFSNVTDDLARDLSEQLRLVLEPTQASRLRGDYRTGRRINMRKVIPYIASQFRKDKIWLRRTKPSKRDYQIALAIDDSSSMADNHSKELAFESLALVTKALTLLESGEIGVISFGATAKVVHPLGDPFTQQSGARLLQQFTFEQKNTRVGQLVDFATAMFMSSRRRISSSNEKAQLLVIVSDGRIISEGHDKVVQVVRRAKENGIFMVFVIIDNPENKDSILDIQQPLFVDAKCVGFKPYLDNFPFPFYLILRDINSLPTVLCDALRQWFELVASG